MGKGKGEGVGEGGGEPGRGGREGKGRRGEEGGRKGGGGERNHKQRTRVISGIREIHNNKKGSARHRMGSLCKKSRSCCYRRGT